MTPEEVEPVLTALRTFGPEGTTVAELRHALDAPPTHGALRRLLKKLSRTGSVVRIDSQVFAAGDNASEVEGILVLEQGLFFVRPDSAGDVEISSEHLLGAVAGDKVLADITFDNGRGFRAGKITRLVDPVPRTVTGVVRNYRGLRILVSDDVGEPILVPKSVAAAPVGQTMTIAIGERVPSRRGVGRLPKLALMAESSDTPTRPSRRGDPFAQVDAKERSATVLLDQLSRSLGIDAPFPDEAVRVAEAARAPESAEEEGRDNLTDIPLVTIDGETAKDFDDAVFAERVGDEIMLLVAIADVASYVEEGSALDIEAKRRGCSVYIPGRVYPMLPSNLSDNVCSLRPNELRRCAWVSMLINLDGDVTEYDAGFGIMRSRKRLTYTQVQRFLDTDKIVAPEAVKDSLRNLDEVRERLFQKRRRRGMLDLDLPEPEIALTEDGQDVEHVEPHPRLRAHRLIEECMLVANETIADLLASRNWPSIHRVHAEPNEEKLAMVRGVFGDLDSDVKLSKVPTVEEIDRVIDRFADTPQGRIFSYMVLRAMPKAEYSTADEGHFGIGARRYSHFTSPIRRYPDLEVHRLLYRALNQRPPDEAARKKLIDRLNDSAKASNQGEQTATQAERSSQRLLTARFMSDYVGEVFEAVVSDVVSFGLFVSVEHPYVDGLVPMPALDDDYYVFDEYLRQLVGSRTGKRYKLGEPMMVRCIDVSVAEGKVGFAPIGSEATGRGSRSGGGNRRKGKRSSNKSDRGSRPGRGSRKR